MPTIARTTAPHNPITVKALYHSYLPEAAMSGLGVELTNGQIYFLSPESQTLWVVPSHMQLHRVDDVAASMQADLVQLVEAQLAQRTRS